MNLETHPRPAPRSTTPGRIRDTALRIFADKGYDGTTTKEICDAARVNVAALHYHFHSKDALYREIVRGFAEKTTEAIERILMPPKTAAELRLRIELYLRETVDIFLKHPEEWQILMREGDLMFSRVEDIFTKTLVRRFSALGEFLVAAKKQGLIGRSIDARFASQFMAGHICHSLRRNAVRGKYFGQSLSDESYRIKWVDDTLALFMNAIQGPAT